MVSAHELAAWARCPRAWWYERHDPRAALGVAELEERLAAARQGRGRRDADAREIAVLERLLARQDRFAHGLREHRAAVLHRPALRLREASLIAALVALTVLAIVLWR